MQDNWRRDAARRKAREKLQRAQERRAAERWAKFWAAAAERKTQLELAFKKSGCETWEEFDELQMDERERVELERAEREQRQRDYCAGFVAKPTGLPNAQELANALTSVHAGGRPVRLPALLIESGRTDDRDGSRPAVQDAAGVGPGGSASTTLHWYRRRVGAAYSSGFHQSARGRMSTSMEAMKVLREQRLAAGLCQSCGQRPPLDGRKACEQCLADQAKRARARRALQWPMCSRCGKRPALMKDVTIAGHTRRRLKRYQCIQCHADQGRTVRPADFLTPGKTV